VAHSAANNKSAFKDIYEASDETLVLARMINKSRKTELHIHRLENEKRKEDERVTYNHITFKINTVIVLVIVIVLVLVIVIVIGTVNFFLK
jgi:hypothetical protein